MPGFFTSKKQSKEAKRRFEHLMLLAKENPNKIFDLSECELYSVPTSLFVQCRVFLTESLIFHSNKLKSLKGGGKMADLSNLRVLDLHSNNITHLPEDINCLKKLQVLNIQNNQISVLPEAIGGLTKLQSLLAKDNILNCLPKTIQTMASLRTLDVSGSNQVFYLPKSLCKVRTLEVLLLSKPHCMEYPPPTVAAEGLEAIQRFICKDCGVEYIPPSHVVLSVLDQTDGTPSSSVINDSLDIQEEKKKLHLEMERQLAETQTQLAMMSSKDKEARHKDYINLRKDVENIEKTIQQQQERKEKERRELLGRLKQVEIDASTLVSNLLNDTEKARHHEALMERMEEQRLQEEQYFRVSQDDIDKLRKQETVAAMQLMLDSNIRSGLAIEKYLAEQDQSRMLAQRSMGEDTVKLEAHLVEQQTNQGVLVRKIMSEENLQKEAFVLLQLQRDAVQIRLMSQIDQLQEELVRLTRVEAKKKSMKMEIEQESLSLIRTELTDLLMQLLKEKDQREETLHQRLIDMEQQRENDQVDFWLVQYQRLLDSKPEILVQKEQGLDNDVIDVLRRADASHHAPCFARHKVTAENIATLSEKQLQSIGVFEVGVRNNIMREIENLVAQRKKIDVADYPSNSPVSPSAPTPSAPSSPAKLAPVPPPARTSEEEVIEDECVVCMERQSDCVLLPCGHVCSCYQCALRLTSCPMCRADITQKIRMYRS